jgi:hypothetical protein
LHPLDKIPTFEELEVHARHTHTLQAIWVLGLIEKLVCIWKIWQIRIMG